MSDQWLYFPCQMGQHSAFIFFDYGIRDTIDAAAPAALLKVRAAFKISAPDGLPTNEEFQDLMALEDGLHELVEKHQSIYVGRITVDGHRHFYIYTPKSESIWSPSLAVLGDRFGYELAFYLEADEQHRGYWQELYPTEDDWQVIKDLQVLEALEKHGDDGTASRRIEHWAYFPAAAAADQFSRWAQGKRYTLESNAVSDDGKFCVRLSHEGTVLLPDITSHTIALRRQASELGGDYDGWETPVCNEPA